jgi:hypothetical protein
MADGTIDPAQRAAALQVRSALQQAVAQIDRALKEEQA